MSNISIKDSVVFVTGANRGIGKAIVEEAVARGAKKVYAAARDTSKLTDLADNVVPIELDVTNDEQISQAASQANDVNILINNAGVAGYSGFIYEYNEDVARNELDVNYFGPLKMTRAFLDTLTNNKNGVIGNVVSVAGFSCFPMAGTYSATKAAAHSLTQGIRAELANQDILVCGIYPGPIDTDMAAGFEMEKESPANVAKRIFDGIAAGEEYITTDKFADDFYTNWQADAKAIEKEVGQMAHQPTGQ